MPRKSLLFLIILIIAVGAGLLLRYIFSFPKELSVPAPEMPASQQNMSSSTNQVLPTTTPPVKNSGNTTKGSSQSAVKTPVSTAKTEIMAWIYPGVPTCNAAREYSSDTNISILKPEYFKIDEGGNLVLLTEEDGCNGYSPKNLADVKKHSKEQYVTVSSSYAGSMDIFLTNVLENNSAVDTLTSFVVDNGMTGVEIDFEDFGGWTGDMYSKYKRFVTALGNSLHKNNKKLMIDGPATSNQTEENWFVWRYADFNSLPVDRLVIMTYDYQYDQGVGEPISPISWIQNTIKWTLKKFPNKGKISVGIPSYGYKGTVGTQHFSLLTYEQIKKEPGFNTAIIDNNSYEMTWKNGDYIYFYQNSYSMSKKLQAIQNEGITSVSVWHLGGNLWFN